MHRVAIVGTGYVGLTVGACLASLGHRVHCIDSDADKVALLSAGSVPILEEGLSELVGAGLEGGRLSFGTDPAAVGDAEVVFLCLPTPQSAEGNLNTAVLEGAVRRLAAHLAPATVLVTKSTVPVGTSDRIAQWLARDDIHVVSNPEFLREGTAVSDFLEGDRVVIGARSSGAADRVAKLYRGVRGAVLRTDPASAELLKFAANAFLAAKISFANEMSRLCDGVGADIDAVMEGIGADHRIGPTFLAPGPGWGGSCFPKDTSALTHLAKQHGLDLPVVSGAIVGNEDQLRHVLAKVAGVVPPRPGTRIAVWGLTYKAGTDDMRDSPAVRIVERLVARGYEVVTYDPAARRTVAGTIGASSPAEACTGAAALLVLTEWPEFTRVQMQGVAALMRGRVVVDGRNLLDAQEVLDAGLDYVGLGRSAHATSGERTRS